MLTSNKSNYAVGVFDSGLGGLTVVKELMRQLPREDIIYFGDTARVPYGTKSKESIIRFSHENTMVLLKHNVKMIVVACNSSSSYALGALQKTYNIPIIGVIEAGARKGVASTKNKRLGVIATTATVQSHAYEKTIKKDDETIAVFSRACPLFVPLVEEGWLNKKVTLDVAGEYLKPLKKARIDTLILGCTHYPLLKSVFRKVLSAGVTLVDSAQEVAIEVKTILEKENKIRINKRKPQYVFLVSDRPQKFSAIAKNFLGYEIDIKRVCKYV